MKLSDLEITKLCAKAMGTPMSVVEPQMLWPTGVMLAPAERELMRPYDPLHDDARAAALDEVILRDNHGFFITDRVFIRYERSSGCNTFETRRDMLKAENRRRAKCECVAKMQKAK